MKAGLVFFKKHLQLIIALTLLFAAFFISRYPFYTYFPIIGFHSDTAVYFMAVEGLLYGQWPKFGVVPPVYPLFLWVVGLISDNILIYAWFQTAIGFLSASFLLVVVYKYLRRLTIFFSIGLSVYFMSSHSIAFETMLITESLYASILIFICALAIVAIYSNKKLSWVWLSFALALPILLRPTGLIVFVLLALILIYFYFNKVHKSYYARLLLPFSSLLILAMIYSLFTLGEVIPQRVLGYLPMFQHNSYEVAIKSYQGEAEPYTREELAQVIEKENWFMRRKGKDTSLRVYTSKHMRLLVFFNAISYESRSFYYDEMYRRYNEFYKNDYMKKDFHHNSLNIAPFSERFKSFIFKNYYQKLPKLDFEDKCDIINNPYANLNRNFIFKIYDFYYKNLGLTVFRSKLWLLLTFLSSLLILYKIFKSRFKDKTAFVFFFMASILFTTAVLMVFTGHNTGSWRYTYPTEFLYYLVPTYIIFYFNFGSRYFNKKE